MIQKDRSLKYTTMTNDHYKLLPISAAVFALVTSGCHQESPTPTTESLAAIQVSVVKAETRERQAFEEVVGSVESRLRAEIAPKVSALVERMLVAPGSVVKKGDLLAQLDDREILARLEQARATSEQAEKDLTRFTELLNNDTITQAEFDAVQARQRVAAAGRDAAVAMLGYTKILAPFDGVITRKLADVGDLASPGRPLLALEDPDALRLEANVPEALIDRLKLGERLVVHVESVSQPIEGTVSEVAPAADPASRTFLVKVDIPSVPDLRLGQFGRLSVPVPGGTALRVPDSALVVRGQMEIVFVVSDGKVQLRLVRTGKHVGDEVELLSGVDPGERVVVDKVRELMDGQPVEVQ